MSDTDDLAAKLRRTREVLNECGWVFDDFVNAETRKWLGSKPVDREAREQAYFRASAAAEMKLGLLQVVQAAEDKAKADEHVKKFREKQQAQGAPTQELH